MVSEELGIVEDGFLFRFRFLFLISFNSELAPRNRAFMAQTLLLPAAEPTKAAFVAKTTAIRSLHRFMSYEFHTNCQ